jgi:hypothetical protein
MSAPWLYDPRVAQGPTPGSPNFREIFPHGASPLHESDKGPDSKGHPPQGEA